MFVEWKPQCMHKKVHFCSYLIAFDRIGNSMICFVISLITQGDQSLGVTLDDVTNWMEEEVNISHSTNMMAVQGDVPIWKMEYILRLDRYTKLQ